MVEFLGLWFRIYGLRIDDLGFGVLPLNSVLRKSNYEKFLIVLGDAVQWGGNISAEFL
jgi:hypothetical protein